MLQKIIHMLLNSPIGIFGGIMLIVAFLFWPRGRAMLIGFFIFALLALWLLALFQNWIHSTEQAAVQEVEHGKHWVTDKIPDWWKKLMPDAGPAGGIIDAESGAAKETTDQYYDCLEDQVCRMHLDGFASNCAQKKTIAEWNRCVLNALSHNAADAYDNSAVVAFCANKEAVVGQFVEPFEHLMCSFIPKLPEFMAGMAPRLNKTLQCPVDLTKTDYVHCLGARPK